MSSNSERTVEEVMIQREKFDTVNAELKVMVSVPQEPERLYLLG